MLGSGKTRDKDVRSVMIWFLKEKKAGERRCGGRKMWGHFTATWQFHHVEKKKKKVFLTLNSKIAKSLSISGRSVIAKSNTGGGERKSEALGARQAKMLEGRVCGMNSPNSQV